MHDWQTEPLTGLPEQPADRHWRLSEHLRETSAWRISATLVCLVSLPLAAHASFTPPDLAPGSHYRLIFVTPDSIDATSTSIATYNGFANTEATQNPSLPSTTWSAVVSTATTNAVTNLDNVCTTTACQNDPIYLVDGTTEVAASQAQLFGGSLLHAIDEFVGGGAVPGFNFNGTGYVWTGSFANGTAAISPATHFTYTTTSGKHVITNTYSFPMGAPRQAEYGVATNSGTAAFAAFRTSKSSSFPIYAISGQLTVPTSQGVPEPMSGSLLLAGGVATGLVRRLRRGRRTAT